MSEAALQVQPAVWSVTNSSEAAAAEARATAETAKAVADEAWELANVTATEAEAAASDLNEAAVLALRAQEAERAANYAATTAKGLTTAANEAIATAKGAAIALRGGQILTGLELAAPPVMAVLDALGVVDGNIPNVNTTQILQAAAQAACDTGLPGLAEKLKNWCHG
jgi:hypothetical protein